MNNFLRELRIELNRRNLYQSEIDEIVSYYEEIINDRLYLIKLDKWALKVKDLIKYYDTSERQFQRKFVRRFGAGTEK